ncbi:MAG: alpha-glucan family phosphorylase [Nitrospiraceae bacterium]|nr:alpha-glucan family phosphorylase [Nitrospira sp.]MCB9774329.1 alpha-glucan family phosphorylase [Nitrospiraceae bacterium]
MNQTRTLTEEFRNLSELAQNVWWSWSPEGRAVFSYIDPTLWRLTYHDPIKQLQKIASDRLEALGQDVVFLSLYREAMKAFHVYMEAKDHWFGRTYPQWQNHTIAYFSAEFGLHRSVPLYSGGLGILAGDHLKEASDLGVPLVAVGFMYSQAYFRQVVDTNGWQEAVYDSVDPMMMPIKLARTPAGDLAKVQVQLGSRMVACVIWQIQVGRVSLYLLDTDTPENSPEDRHLTARLYGGDHRTRLCQELLLGIGGVRALRAVGCDPDVWHANEGHPAFFLVERMREQLQQGLSLSEAAAQVRQNTVFTTHTPVPAGHDVFSGDLIREHCQWWWEEVGLTQEDFMALGRHPELSADQFHMTTLPIRLASFINGVSKEHEQVSKKMFHILWPERPLQEVPIHSVTNGVHVPTWIAQEMDVLYQKYLGSDWRERCDDPSMWQRMQEVPDGEIWEVRQFLKRKLLTFIRQRARMGWMDGTMEPIQVLASGAFLEPHSMTLGFARRFASYKRATLLFSDLDRLKQILLNPWRPVQIIFAGKSHPADQAGRELIHRIYQFAKAHHLGGHIAFVEDYDMHVAKFLVQGVDVWLNNPRPPLEASGTSGQKAALNGVPNLSVLDGWWKEGYDGSNGWAVPLPEEPLGDWAQDDLDMVGLYTKLENEVIPLYYDRGVDGVPHGWCTVVKNSIRTSAPRFSARRMLKEYVKRAYTPLFSEAGKERDAKLA